MSKINLYNKLNMNLFTSKKNVKLVEMFYKISNKRNLFRKRLKQEKNLTDQEETNLFSNHKIKRFLTQVKVYKDDLSKMKESKQLISDRSSKTTGIGIDHFLVTSRTELAHSKTNKFNIFNQNNIESSESKSEYSSSSSEESSINNDLKKNIEKYPCDNIVLSKLGSEEMFSKNNIGNKIIIKNFYLN